MLFKVKYNLYDENIIRFYKKLKQISLLEYSDIFCFLWRSIVQHCHSFFTFCFKNFHSERKVPIFNFCHLFGKDDRALIFTLPLILVIILKILTKPYITLDILIVEGITFWYTKRARIIVFFPVILEGNISGGLSVMSYVSRYVPKRQKSSRHMEINVLIFHW